MSLLVSAAEASRETVSALESSSLEAWNQFSGYFPLMIAAIIVLLVGWVLIKVLQVVTSKVLRLVGLNKLATKLQINDFLAKMNIEMSLSDVIAKIVYFLSLIVVFKTVVQVLRLHEVTEALDAVLSFVTTGLLSAAIIVGVGLYIGNMVRTLVLNLGEKAKFAHAKFMANAAQIAILIFVAIPAMDKLGVNSSIFQNNITILIAGFALAIGLGGKKTAERIIEDLYERFKA